MKVGKLIVIEGTDCSGKETQSNLLLQKLSKENYKIIKMQFPRYDTPTGRIIAGPLLGKKEYGETYFKNDVSRINPKVASLYYAADRLYNIEEIKKYIKNGYTVILDRYVESNMGHQAGKLINHEERENCYKFLETLEYDLLELPKPDLTLFLYMPLSVSKILKKNRLEEPDEVEKDESYLENSEKAYLELAARNNFKKIDCSKDGNPRQIDEINQEIFNIVKGFLDAQ